MFLEKRFRKLLHGLNINFVRTTGIGGIAFFSALSILSIQPATNQTFEAAIIAYFASIGLNIGASQIEKWLEGLATSSSSSDQKRVEDLARILSVDIRKNNNLSIELGKFVGETRSYDIALEVLKGNESAIGWLAINTYTEVEELRHSNEKILVAINNTKEVIEKGNSDFETVYETLQNLVSIISSSSASEKKQEWHYFPRVSESFVGRFDEIEQLTSALKSKMIVSIWGMGGIGKTELAKKIISETIHYWDGGILWASLSPEDAILVDERENVILETWIAAYPVATIYKSARLTLQNLLARSSGKILIIIDDVWRENINLFESLIKVVENFEVTILFTTRQKHIAANYSDTIFEPLSGLLPQDIDRLFEKNFTSATNYQDYIQTLARKLEYHALAIIILMAWLRKRGINHIPRLVERINRHSETSNPLQELNLGESRNLSLEIALSMSLTSLESEYQDIDIRRMFSYLGVFPRNTPFTEMMLLQVWDLDSDSVERERAEDLVSQFVQDALIFEEVDFEYLMHSAMHDYARLLLNRHYSDDMSLLQRRYFSSIYRHYVHVMSQDSVGRRRHIERSFNHIIFWASVTEKTLQNWAIEQNAPWITNSPIEIIESDYLVNSKEEESILSVWLSFVLSIGEYITRYHFDTIGEKWFLSGLIAASAVQRDQIWSIAFYLINWYSESAKSSEADDLLKYLASSDDGSDNLAASQAQQELLFGNVNQALEQFRALLDFNQDLDSPQKVSLINSVGYCELALGNVNVAIDRFNEALDLLKEYPDSDFEAIILKHLGAAKTQSGKFDEAEALLQASLTIRKERYDVLGEQATLHSLAEMYYAKGDVSSSLAILEDILQFYNENGLFRRAVVALGNLGLTLLEMGEDYAQDGLEKVHEAIEMRINFGDSSGAARNLEMLGKWQVKHSDQAQGIANLYKAAKLYQKQDEHWRAAVTLQNIAMIFEESEVDKAIEQYTKSIQPLIKLKKRKAIGDTYLHVGRLYLGIRNYEEALQHFRESVRIYKEVRSFQSVVGSLMWQAQLAKEAGEKQVLESTLNDLQVYLPSLSEDIQFSLNLAFTRAVLTEDFPFALDAIDELINEISETSSLTTIDQSKALVAQPFLKKAIELGRKLNQQELLIFALLTQGQLSIQLELYTDAKTIYFEAQNLVNTFSIDYFKWISLHELGIACRRLNENQEAIMWQKKALQRAKYEKDQIRIAVSLSALGIASFYLSHEKQFDKPTLKKTRRYHKQALRIFTELNDLFNIGMEYYNLHMTYFSCTAVDYLDKALETWDNLPAGQRPAHYYRGSSQRTLLAKKFRCD